MEELFQGLREAPNLHPLFLHFPLVLLPLALLFWILALAVHRDDLVRFGRWLLYLAAASVVAASWTGFLAEDQVGHESRLHELLHRHKALMLVTSGLTLLLALSGFLLRKTRDFGPNLALATTLAATVTIMTFGADHGGHAVFGHGIGTRTQRDGPLPEVSHPDLEVHPHRVEGNTEPAQAPKPETEKSRPRPEEKTHEHEGVRQPEGQQPSPPPSGQGKTRSAHPMAKGPLGLPHAREASGTSWQPDSTPVHAVHFMEGDWTFMAHGNAFAGYDYQSGKRGQDAWMSTNWLMLMARRPLAGGELGLRTMLSFEPATARRAGYPLLLQTGEALGGRPLHDAQHPHDLFMELAAVYARPVSEDLALEIYAAPSGEPALGPAAFPHRMSAAADPLAPLGHHWQDSTHISFGVLTAGVFTRHMKLEGSWFNGREPDENRWDFDLRTPDSYSVRLSVNPDEHLSAQVSTGRLRSPEQLEPDVSLDRWTASVTINQPWGEVGNWATTLAWGRNKPEGERATNSFLLESNLELDRHHNPFARIEFVRKSGHDLVLTPGLEDETFGIGSVAVGYAYHLDPMGSIVPGLGFRFTVNLLEEGLEPFYGRRPPVGFMIFLRLRPARIREAAQGEGKDHH